MKYLLLSLVLMQTSTGAGDMDAAQFRNVIKELYSAFKDVSFVFEGEMDVPGYKGKLEKRAFQGYYAYTVASPSYVLDVYFFQDDPALGGLTRDTSALKAGMLDHTARADNRKKTSIDHTKANGATLNRPASPHRFLYLWLFNEMIERLDLHNYRFVKWEDIDRHRCAVVELDAGVGPASPQNPYFRLWVDFERGGHVLKAEYRHGQQVVLRAHKIRLSQVETDDGKQMWFPMVGAVESFASERGIESSPTSTESYGVVLGSLRINKGLPESLFAIDSPALETNPSELDHLRKALSTRNPPPPPRRDPEGVQADLDARLAEAERQGKQLDASAGDDGSALLTNVLPYVLGGFGVIAIVGAIILMRRRG